MPEVIRSESRDVRDRRKRCNRCIKCKESSGYCLEDNFIRKYHLLECPSEVVQHFFISEVRLKMEKMKGVR
jgi:hypothetical protein